MEVTSTQHYVFIYSLLLSKWSGSNVLFWNSYWKRFPTKAKKLDFPWKLKKLKNTNFIAPFYGCGSTASELQSHYEEAVYFLLLSSQRSLVLIWSTLEGQKAESNLEPPRGNVLVHFCTNITNSYFCEITKNSWCVCRGVNTPISKPIPPLWITPQSLKFPLTPTSPNSIFMAAFGSFWV